MEECKIKVDNYKNGHCYKYKNKRVVVITADDDDESTYLSFKRLNIVQPKDHAGLKKLNGLETTIHSRPHSKYIVIETLLKVSLPSIECLHHGIGEVLKIHAMNREDKELNDEG